MKAAINCQWPFIAAFNPYIIKIIDDGRSGRLKRGSSQTERHIKAIQTRVNRIKPDSLADNSRAALKAVLKMTQ